jgi:phage terminase large subunit-like protein
VRHRPRVEVAPEFSRTYGPQAVELARVAGLTLDPWQCDALELMMAVREDGKWACFEYGEIVSRQNGKGSILEARAIAGFLLLGEQLIMWSAHEYKTAMEAFRRCRTLLRALGEPAGDNLIDIDGVMVKVSNTNGEESFERLDTGARIKFIARSKGSGRGFSGDCNIIDETFAYTDDQHSALMPTMSARPNPQIIYTSSPPLNGDTGEILFRLRKRAEDGSRRLGYRDWGLPGSLDDLKSIDLDDRGLWLRTNPGMGSDRRLPSEEFIEAERESMSPEKFAIERLGLWPRQKVGGGDIDLDKWMDLILREAQRSGDVSLAVDIAPNRDYAAIGMFARTEDGAPFVRLLSYRPGVDWLIDSIVEWRTTLEPIGIAMGRGTYASIGTDLEKAGIKVPDTELGPRRGDVCALNSVSMSAACGQFIDGVNQGSFRWVPDDAGAILASVRGAKTKLTGDTIAWSRKEADTDTSPLVSITAAKWLHGEWAHLVDKQNTQPFFGAWR